MDPQTYGKTWRGKGEVIASCRFHGWEHAFFTMLLEEHRSFESLSHLACDLYTLEN